MSRPALLDASFLIDLERETALGEVGPARRFLNVLRGRPIAVSVVTVAELLEGADDESATWRSLQRFVIQGVHTAQARNWARLRRGAPRQMSENDGWLVATAESIDADVVGADRAAFERLGERYLRFR